MQLGWGISTVDVTWSLRYLSSVKEACANALLTPVPGCPNSPALATDYHTLESMLYNDIAISWSDAFKVTGLRLDGGVNNVFGKDPPICYTCTLNGYDAGTYDLPGAFWNVRATYKF